ncbi:MAG: hypothetical protein LBG95_09240 [Treponema sp.]|jgi:hypothetical protein|nr:hypothetical protein [Treponema sp.]
MNKKFSLRGISPLRVALFTGLMLLLPVVVILAGLLIRGGGSLARGMERESAFHRLLREYDYKYGQIPQTGSDAVRRQGFERLDGDLDRLEKKAGGVESWLSVLKRRRQLARLDYRYEQSYRRSAGRAAQAFPYSEPIAAIAAAALIYDSAIDREGEEYLRNVLPLLANSRFAPIRLSLYALLGDFKNPEKAEASIPRDFIMPASFSASSPDVAAIYADLILMKIIAGDIPSAAIDIQAALTAFPSPALIRLAAEYFYDFGSLLHSAELFSKLPDEAALSRQADALWLAGYADNARAIWAILANTGGAALQNRALYNLALTAPTQEEKAALLDKLVTERRPATGDDSSRRFGLIRFSRFMEAPQALAVLAAERESADDALVDLETLKRRTEIAEMARIFAETWMLIECYPELEYLYQWGAWYFNLQRNYAESAKLLQIAARNNFTSDWMELYGALQQINDGNINAAEELLDAAVVESGHWAAFANLGRVLESRRAPARALENYEKAMAAAAESYDISEEDWQKTASRIQLRIALCLKTLGKTEESSRALAYALELNPDNLTARLELSRLE